MKNSPPSCQSLRVAQPVRPAEVSFRLRCRREWYPRGLEATLFPGWHHSIIRLLGAEQPYRNDGQKIEYSHKSGNHTVCNQGVDDKIVSDKRVIDHEVCNQKGFGPPTGIGSRTPGDSGPSVHCINEFRIHHRRGEFATVGDC